MSAHMYIDDASHLTKRRKRRRVIITFLSIVAMVAVFLHWKSIELYEHRLKDAEKQAFTERKILTSSHSRDGPPLPPRLDSHKRQLALAGTPQTHEVLTSQISTKSSVTTSSPSTMANPKSIATSTMANTKSSVTTSSPTTMANTKSKATSSPSTLATIKSKASSPSTMATIKSIATSVSFSHATTPENGALPNHTAQPQPIPYMGNYHNCSDLLCSEFLTAEDKERSQKCGGNRMPISVKCHFMDGTNRSPVALASYPGSGNTWVRGLLEQVTGICTGSVYCDGQLRSRGMNGEGLNGGSVLVTKTHSVRPMKWGSILTTENHYGVEYTDYGAAILLIRNPFEAIVSYNKWLKSGSHTRDMQNPIGDGQVQSGNRWWKGMFMAWIEANIHNKPILVVKYEDLKSNKIAVVKRMLDFLKVPYAEDELQKRLADDYTDFHRPHDASDFDPFTTEQRISTRNAIQETLDLLREKNNGESFGIESYLDL